MISNEAPWLNLKDLVCLSFFYEWYGLLPLSHPHFRINFLLNFWIGLFITWSGVNDYFKPGLNVKKLSNYIQYFKILKLETIWQPMKLEWQGPFIVRGR